MLLPSCVSHVSASPLAESWVPSSFFTSRQGYTDGLACFFENLCVSFPFKQIPRSRIAESKFMKDHNFHRSCKKVMPIYTFAKSGGDSLLPEITCFAAGSPTLRMVTWDKCVKSMLLEVSGSSRSGFPRFLDFTCGYTLQKEWWRSTQDC